MMGRAEALARAHFGYLAGKREQTVRRLRPQ